MLKGNQAYAKYNSHNSSWGEECLSGSIHFREDRQRWFVSWYHNGKRHFISKYHGKLMHRTHPKKNKDHGYKTAEKLLAQMQGDVENGVFRIEKYNGKAYTDVIPFYEEWLKTKEKKKPATYKGYKSYFKNWIRPFFEENPVQLHEIQLDTLDRLLDSIKLQPKGKHNVMMAFHAFMDYAWRSRRIFEIPPFPKKEDYDLVVPTIKWLPEARQVKVIEAIPEEHQPIFWFLKYHLRRPAEACALFKEDYDIINKVFIIKRSISARVLVETTKTHAEHTIPCHSNMIPLIDYLSQQPGKFMFENPRARKKDMGYQLEALNRLWNKACEDVGEKINMYAGLKHSSCSQFINEKNMSISDLQTITDHARLDSVRRYAKTEVARKRTLLESGNKTDLLALLKVVK